MDQKGQTRSHGLLIPIIAAIVVTVVVVDYLLAGTLSAFVLGFSRVQRFRIIGSLLVTAAIYLVIELLKKSYLYYVTDLQARHKVRRMLQWIRVFLTVAALVFIWSGGVKDYGVIFGLVGAGLALSLQEIILSISGWVYIMLNQPFDIGDRIEINGNKGDVIDISVLHSTLVEVGSDYDAEQSTGRLLIVPNASFIRYCSTNFTKGFAFIWNELRILITFESDWERAKEILLSHSAREDEKFSHEVEKQIQTTQETYAIRFGKCSSIVYTSIEESGVCLTLRYLCPVRHKRSTAHSLYESILKSFAKEPGIDFAYPTTRFFKTTADKLQPNE